MYRMDKGRPVVYTHVCSEERRGQNMTAEELHAFAVEVLAKEYANTGAQVTRYHKHVGCEADFCFTGTGKGPQFKGGKGMKKVNVMLVCRDKQTADISDVDTSWLVAEYRRTGVIPRVTLAFAYCFGNENKEATAAVCGGDFCFKYYSVSPLPDESNEAVDQNLTAVELAAKYAESWKQGDASVIAPYLDKDFHYGSHWVFDEMPSRKEFLDYFKGKLDAIRRTHSLVEVSVGRNHQTGRSALIVRQNGDTSTLELTTENGRIKSAFMNEFDRKYKPMNPEDELYQNHGDHLDSIMPASELLKNHLQDIINQAIPWRICRNHVTTEEMYEQKTKVLSTLFGEGDLRMLTTFALSCDASHYDFMSIYPAAKGVSTEVCIEKVLEWDNQVEATVVCSCGNFHFAFFASDYYCNKAQYRAGQTLSVDLAAIGMRVTEGERGFQFEGKDAVDWLAKIGKHPDYDEYGKVQPVRFNMEHLVSFLNLDSKCPDEAQFQSPVGKVECLSVLGVDFYKTDIVISRESGNEEGLDEVKVPLYFRQDFLNHVEEGDPVSGWLWLTGGVTGMHDTSNVETYELQPADIALEFERFMSKQDFGTFENLMPVLAQLPLLEIRQGYEFDAFRRGDNLGSEFRPYCCKANPAEDYDPKKHAAYDDSLNIDGLLDYEHADMVPEPLAYFKVPFTEQGIMQAWLLDNVKDFMPKRWHAKYGEKHFVFDTESLAAIFPNHVDTSDGMIDSRLKEDRMEVYEEVLALDWENLLPAVQIDGNSAVLEYAFWNDWRGLAKEKVSAVRCGESVRFTNCNGQVLVPYSCGIYF